MPSRRPVVLNPHHQNWNGPGSTYFWLTELCLLLRRQDRDCNILNHSHHWRALQRGEEVMECCGRSICCPRYGRLQTSCAGRQGVVAPARLVQRREKPCHPSWRVSSWPFPLFLQSARRPSQHGLHAEQKRVGGCILCCGICTLRAREKLERSISSAILLSFWLSILKVRKTPPSAQSCSNLREAPVHPNKFLPIRSESMRSSPVSMVQAGTYHFERRPHLCVVERVRIDYHRHL